MYDRDDSRSSGRMDAHGGLARDGTRCPCETTADVLYTHTHSVRYLRPDSISRSFGCAAQNIAEQLFLDPVSLFQSYMQWVYIYFDTYIYWAAHQFIKKHLRERGGIEKENDPLYQDVIQIDGSRICITTDWRARKRVGARDKTGERESEKSPRDRKASNKLSGIRVTTDTLHF